QCIEMVSTPIVIEVVRKSLIPDTSLEQIVEEINRVHPYVGRIITNETKRRVLKQKPRTIITTCITGKGTAIKLEKLIRSGIPIINEYNIEIKAMKYNYQTIDNDNVIAVVGAINPKVPHTPFISIDDLILGDGYKRLEAIIYNSDIQEDTTYHSIDSNINLISKTLKELLTFLDPSKAYHLANQSFEYIAQNYKITDKNRKKLLYVFHVAGMIERIMKN
ncbi:sigma-54-dependent transcriptional regulator, partial [Pseudomonas lundensis]|nr:sigma-54-dependent transcriptional regulator [Pseudomonas lundensis]